MKRACSNPDCFSLLSACGTSALFKDEKGQTLVEYSLLLVLIAVVVVLMVKGVGSTANNTYSKVNSSVSAAVQGS